MFLNIIFAIFIFMIARTAWLLILDHGKDLDKHAVKFVYRGGVKYIKAKHCKGFKW